MTELEKLQRAKMYIDKLANGINPIDDRPAADSDIINNIRLSRCLFYVSGILGQVIDNHGVIGKAKVSKEAFSISAEDIRKFEFSATPITISEMTKRLNSVADLDACHKLNYSAITSWLMEIGALESRNRADGKSTKRPTEQGEALGISTEKRTGVNGEYVVVLYNREAQQFIIDNLEAITANLKNASSKKIANQGLAWTPAHEECLVDLFTKNVPISEIAVTLMRTETGIRSRLKRLGLIENGADIK